MEELQLMSFLIASSQVGHFRSHNEEASCQNGTDMIVWWSFCGNMRFLWESQMDCLMTLQRASGVMPDLDCLIIVTRVADCLFHNGRQPNLYLT
jgi:hypothetical protein